MKERQTEAEKQGKRRIDVDFLSMGFVKECFLKSKGRGGVQFSVFRYIAPALLILGGMISGGQRKAHAEPIWRGLYRNLLVFPLVNGFDVYDTNTLRLDAYVTSLDEAIRLRAILDVDGNVGSERAMALGRDLFPPEGGAASAATALDIYRLFLQVRGATWVATAGRQRIAWGTGTLLRPSNPFEPIRFFEPFQESHGVDALRLMLTPGQSVYMESVVRLDERSEGYQLALATGLRLPERFEFFGNVVRDTIHGRNQVGVALDVSKPIHFWLDGAHRYQYGVPHTDYDHETHVVLLEVGMDHEFKVQDGLKFGVEYLFLSNGDPLGGGDLLDDAIEDYRVFQGPHYAVGQVVWKMNASYAVQSDIVWNLVDGSLALRPLVQGWYADSLRLALGGLFYIGGHDTEFSRSDVDSSALKALPFVQTVWSF